MLPKNITRHDNLLNEQDWNRTNYIHIWNCCVCLSKLLYSCRKWICTSTYHLTASSWLLVDLAVILSCCVWAAGDHTLPCRKWYFRFDLHKLPRVYKTLALTRWATEVSKFQGFLAESHQSEDLRRSKETLVGLNWSSRPDSNRW